jgi:hypothetical protein
MPHIHCVARQNKLEIPNDEEEVNTRYAAILEDQKRRVGIERCEIGRVGGCIKFGWEQVH